jgi:enoyl-CoA hydratase/carnithine racemase
MFTGRRYDAADGLAMGLVHEIVADAELEVFVDGVLKTLTENAPLAIANSKTIIEEYVKASGAPDHKAMDAAIDRCARSADYEEGRKAFMEKRKPRFQGK